MIRIVRNEESQRTELSRANGGDATLANKQSSRCYLNNLACSEVILRPQDVITQFQPLVATAAGNTKGGLSGLDET